MGVRKDPRQMSKPAACNPHRSLSSFRLGGRFRLAQRTKEAGGMRANRHGRHAVYTERGPGATARSDRPLVTVELPVAPEIPARDAALPVPLEKLCPHGGTIIDDLPRCGLCFEAKGAAATPEESYKLFQLSLYELCRKVAAKHDFRGIPFWDRAHGIFILLMEPRNLRAIRKAKSRFGMAWKIANDRMTDMKRAPYHWKEWSVSQLNFGDMDDDVRLDLINQDTPDRRRNSGDSDTYSVGGAHGIETSFGPPPEEIRYFPGVNLVWTESNFDKLKILLAEALDKLARYPFDLSIAIKFKVGFYTEKMTTEEIAEWASDARGVKITPRQVSYAIDKGLLQMRAHLESSFAPRITKT